MSLRDLALFLISADDHEPASLYQRAISLFEFQVSLFDTKWFSRLLKAKPTAKLQQTRALATVKILQKLENDIKSRNNSVTISIRELAESESYRFVFDRLFLPNCGWHQIARSISQRAFDKVLAKRSVFAQAAANVIDVSYRFSQHPPKIDYRRHKNPGGVEAARYVVRNAYRPAVGETKIKEHWGKCSRSAVFLYLIFCHNFDLKPPELNSPEFVDKLLHQAEDVATLQSFFCGYQMIQAALSDLNYDFPTLDLDLRGSPPVLSVPIFSPEMENAFSDWIRG